MDNLPGLAVPGFEPRHLEAVFRSLQGCCLHSPVWLPADAERVLCSVWSAYSDSVQDCAVPDEYGSLKPSTESESWTVARLKDGRFGLLAESEDYTGHGCQCSAATNVYDSVGDLLQFGVEDGRVREAIRLRLAVPGAVVTDSGELEAATSTPKAAEA